MELMDGWVILLDCYDHCGAIKNGLILPTGQWVAPSAVIDDA